MDKCAMARVPLFALRNFDRINRIYRIRFREVWKAQERVSPE
jgi:hypothetical protein